MLNRCEFIGRLGKDPEIRNANNGTQVASFSIATSERWKDKQTGEKKEKTEWINIVAWSPLSEIVAKYVHKGDQIYIAGKFRTKSWEKDGITRYSTDIQATEIVLLGGNNKPTGQTQSHDEVPTTSNEAISSDDLPF